VSATSRPYADEADYAQMRRLLIDIVALGGDAHYCTVGDLDWWRFTSGDNPDSAQQAQLWFAPGGALIGIAWPSGTQVDLMVHPDNRAVEAEMLAWAEARRRETGADEAGPLTFTAWSYDGDAPRIALLRAQGYERTETVLRYRRRSLDGALPEPPLPPGYTIRNMAGEDDLERRVAVHRAAFAPSKMTTAKHRAVMASLTYRPELDLFTVAPDSSFASYCIVWFDAANRIGVFEPVGTHPDHQRRGLGKVVLAEGFRRLRALGAEKAFVASTGDTNPASNALYESVGFRLVDEFHAWKKAL
jgi:mycothiol synthase